MIKKKTIPEQERENLDQLSKDTAASVIEESEATAKKVVGAPDDPDSTIHTKEDGESNIPDDVVAESAERRKQAANSEGEVNAIEEAEHVRLTTESTLPDNPSDKVTVLASDAKVLNFSRKGPGGKNSVEFVDGKATVTPEEAAELKREYPTLITIL